MRRRLLLMFFEYMLWPLLAWETYAVASDLHNGKYIYAGMMFVCGAICIFSIMNNQRVNKQARS